jgi:hypothetical protein
MKKFIAVIAAVASVAASTSIASAAPLVQTNAPGGSTSAANFSASFNGNVSGTCALTVTDGTLPTNQGFTSSLTTVAGGEGIIETVCNTTTSNLVVALDTGSTPTIPAALSYAEQYSLSGGTGAYAATNVAFTAAPTTVNDLSNGFSATASKVLVAAKGAVLSGNNLPAGSYLIKVKATVTP